MSDFDEVRRDFLAWHKALNRDPVLPPPDDQPYPCDRCGTPVTLLEMSFRVDMNLCEPCADAYDIAFSAWFKAP